MKMLSYALSLVSLLLGTTAMFAADESVFWFEGSSEAVVLDARPTPCAEAYGSAGVHAGRLAEDETWTADAVHVVTHWVVVPKEHRLTISAGAIVKFAPNTGILVERGGENEERGELVLVSDGDHPTYLTSLADDSIGGDTDGVDATPEENTYALVGLGNVEEKGGFVSYRYWNEAASQGLKSGAVTMGSGVATWTDGSVRIPVNVNATRENPFAILWAAEDDTAQFGVDYLMATGAVTWVENATETHYITIPLKTDANRSQAKRFTIRILAGYGVSFTPETTTVYLYGNDGGAQAVGETAEYVRLDARQNATLVHGLEIVGVPDGTSSAIWDTTLDPDGAKTFAVGADQQTVQICNAQPVVGGRLTTNETWTASNGVYVVRHWVVVPEGVTLAIDAGTIVKFAPNAGIYTEPGSTLRFGGTEVSPVYLTSIADDTLGGDTDGEEATPTTDCYAVVANGTVDDGTGWVDFRYANVSASQGSQGTSKAVLTVKNGLATWKDGVAKIPIAVSSARSLPYRLTWRANDGTAIYGSDYTQQVGVVTWAANETTTKYIEIPLVTTADSTATKEFTVSFEDAFGTTISPASVTVTLVQAGAMWYEGETASPVRFDARGTNTLGGVVAHGVETRGSVTGGVAVAWNTAMTNDGWQMLSETIGEGTNAFVDVLTLNTNAVQVQGGRLAENTIWNSNAVHVVRHWVVVPNGVSLVIDPGAVVKFTEHTGIFVENGGSVKFVGTEVSPVRMTTLADDTSGGDTDERDDAMSEMAYAVVGIGSVDDTTGWTDWRGLNESSSQGLKRGALTLTGGLATWSDGIVKLPVSVATTRTVAFGLHWQAVDGTAKADIDYLKTSGSLSWSANGTNLQYIEIPLNTKADTSQGKEFTVTIDAGYGMSVSPQTVRVVLYEGCVAWSEGASTDAVRLDAREVGGFGSALASGTELLGSLTGGVATAWNTCETTNGWNVCMEDTNTVEVLVVNDEGTALHGGRLTSNETWTADALHVVRHWVIVPSGMTLSVDPGAVVKFLNHTGVFVENGGNFTVAGTAAAPVRLTAFEDDVRGGDTDGRETEPNGNAFRIVGIGTVSDTAGWTEYRYLDESTCQGVKRGAMTLTGGLATWSDGVVKLPVSVATTRSVAFGLHWQTVDGSAQAGTDFLTTSGDITYAANGGGVQYIEIPLNTAADTSQGKEFTVRIDAGYGVTVSPQTVRVVLYEGCLNWQTGETANAVRFDAREVTALGGRIAHGIEREGQVGGSAASDWNTALTADGWTTRTCGETNVDVLVMNRAGVTVQEGRLAVDETWNADTLHVVRHWVVVPSGKKLTIQPGAIVKFAAHTGIFVENGGAVELMGTDVDQTHLTAFDDDTLGGDTDGRSAAVIDTPYCIVGIGSVIDTTGWVDYRRINESTSQNFKRATISMVDGLATWTDGYVKVPVNVTATRGNAFGLAWKAVDETAKLDVDYLLGSGNISWSANGSGMQYITIPLDPKMAQTSNRTFRVTVESGLGAVVTPTSVGVTLFGSAEGCSSTGESSAVRLEARPAEKIGSRIASGKERKGDLGGGAAVVWDTTSEENGWKTFTQGTNVSEVLVLNGGDVRVHGGRLARDEVWAADVVHVVRNWVSVPSGRTLTLVEGSAIKFCENVGFFVEDGGRLVLIGNEANRVVMTAIDDDSIGGNTDGREGEPEGSTYQLVAIGAVNDLTGYTDFRHYDSVAWTPTVSTEKILGTGSGTVPYAPATGERGGYVPHKWLVDAGLVANGANMIEVINQLGKVHANGCTGWESFVAGLNPKDETSVFKAEIRMEDGVPKVKWTPDLTDTAEMAVRPRVYTVYGKTDLMDVQWKEVPNGSEADYKFFKVSVKMPQ